MNTPAHLIFGAALARPEKRGMLAAGLLGGLLPDLSLYLLAGVSLIILRIPPERVFSELYFSDSWQLIFAIDNSFFLWGLGLVLALWLRSERGAVFAGAGLIHIFTDFLLHHDDGRRHFWPLSDWKFESPVSYWDSAHHAGYVAPLEGLICIGITVYLWRLFPHWAVRALMILLLALELWTIYRWIMFF